MKPGSFCFKKPNQTNEAEGHPFTSVLSLSLSLWPQRSLSRGTCQLTGPLAENDGRARAQGVAPLPLRTEPARLSGASLPRHCGLLVSVTCLFVCLFVCFPGFCPEWNVHCQCGDWSKHFLAPDVCLGAHGGGSWGRDVVASLARCAGHLGSGRARSRAGSLSGHSPSGPEPPRPGGGPSLEGLAPGGGVTHPGLQACPWPASCRARTCAPTVGAGAEPVGPGRRLRPPARLPGSGARSLVVSSCPSSSLLWLHLLSPLTSRILEERLMPQQVELVPAQPPPRPAGCAARTEARELSASCRGSDSGLVLPAGPVPRVGTGAGARAGRVVGVPARVGG